MGGRVGRVPRRPRLPTPGPTHRGHRRHRPHRRRRSHRPRRRPSRPARAAAGPPGPVRAGRRHHGPHGGGAGVAVGVPRPEPGHPETRRSARRVRRGRPLAARARNRARRLRGRRPGPRHPDLADRAVRAAFDPAARPHLAAAGLEWADAVPVAAREDWDLYRHDSGVSVSWALREAPARPSTPRSWPRWWRPARTRGG